MKLSARNQFAGKVAKVEEGAVNGIVTIDVKGTPVTATISMNAIKELGLAEGKDAVAVIKATEVMVATGDVTLSARNKFAGKVAAVEKGAVNDIVKIDTAFGTVSATIRTLSPLSGRLPLWLAWSKLHFRALKEKSSLRILKKNRIPAPGEAGSYLIVLFTREPILMISSYKQIANVSAHVQCSPINWSIPSLFIA